MLKPIDWIKPKHGSSTESRQKAATLIALVSVLLAFVIFFHKSVFQGKPLAKLANLTHIDALFNPALKQAVIDIGRDPSGYLIFFPNGHFEDSMWSRFVAPLWNPLVACGYPLFGDPQSLMHSPAHLLRLFSSPDAYQIGLLLEIALGGIGMVLLSRFYKLSIPASILAALAFVLSPRILVQVDISGNECLFPFVFLGFAWLAARPSPLRAALVGALCALIAYSSHPETCFFAVLFAAVLSFFTMAIPERVTATVLPESAPSRSAGGSPASTPSPESSNAGNNTATNLFNPISLLRNIFKAIGLLLITAFVSISIAAPLVLPFLEFMRNAYIYKDASGFTTPLSIQQFIDGFYINQGQEPFFLGAIAAMLVPLGFLSKFRTSCAFFLTLLFGFAICLPQGPMIQLLAQKPISYVATMYGVPDLLLMMAVLAGMGLDLILDRPSKMKTFLLGWSATVVIFLPYTFLKQATGTNDFHILWRTGNTLLTATSLFAEIAFVICVLGGRWLPARYKVFCAVGLTALNFASLALVDRNILPVTEKFSLKDPPAPIAFLKEHPGRCLATGSNFFLPNANLDFGIEDFRNFSPLLPLRYKKFLDETGARCYNLYFYVMPERCSKLLDLASIKYVLTRSAVRGEEPTDVNGAMALGECKVKRLVPGFRILQSKLHFDPVNSQVDADMTLRVHQVCNYRYAIQYCVIDADGKELWSTRELMLSPAEGTQHTSDVHESWPISRSAKFPISIGLRVKDTWISQFVKPDNDVEQVGGAFLLCTVKSNELQQRDLKMHLQTYRLLQEFPGEGARIYENQRSLPPAYLTKNAAHFKRDDSDSVWKALKDPQFDCSREVLLEDDEQGKVYDTTNTIAPVPITRPDCNAVNADCNADADCWLVLTDSYYPGWKCYVDGKETKVFPANYLFRAIKLTKGQHTVRFKFMPESYIKGLTLAGGVFVFVALFVWLRRKELFAKDEAV